MPNRINSFNSELDRGEEWSGINSAAIYSLKSRIVPYQVVSAAVRRSSGGCLSEFVVVYHDQAGHGTTAARRLRKNNVRSKRGFN